MTIKEQTLVTSGKSMDTPERQQSGNAGSATQYVYSSRKNPYQATNETSDNYASGDPEMGGGMRSSIRRTKG